MRIFLLGDFKSDNGPGNANKQIKESLLLKYEVAYSRAEGKLRRIVEMRKEIRNSELLIICSASKINYAAIKLAQKQHKKIIYLMHGYMSYEKKIENPNLTNDDLKNTYDYEKFIFDNVDCIVCVSKKFMEFMKSKVSQYKSKFDYVFNVVDTEYLEGFVKKYDINKKGNQILSIGGGMKQKNILTISKALSQCINRKRLVVVGQTLSDGEKIRKFDNVVWYEHLKHEELYKILLETDIYIQNSIFETFGLAIIEALYAGCSVLISKEIGCLDLFDDVNDNDIIYDVYNQKEIEDKVEYLLKNPNNDRLMQGFKKAYISKEWQINRWNEIIENLLSS